MDKKQRIKELEEELKKLQTETKTEIPTFLKEWTAMNQFVYNKEESELDGTISFRRDIPNSQAWWTLSYDENDKPPYLIELWLNEEDDDCYDGMCYSSPREVLDHINNYTDIPKGYRATFSWVFYATDENDAREKIQEMYDLRAYGFPGYLSALEEL